MKRSKVFEQILNELVLLGSLAIIIVASIELLQWVRRWMCLRFWTAPSFFWGQ